MHLLRSLCVIAGAAACFDASEPCRANLGDTPERIKARYGSLIEKFGTDTDKTFRFRRTGTQLDSVDVTFQNGKSAREAYYHWKSKAFDTIDSTGSYSRTEIDSILQANAQGLTWRAQQRTATDLPASMTLLLGSNNPSTAVAKAFVNSESHSVVVQLLSYSYNATTDAATAAALEAMFPMPAKTPEPVRAPIALKPGLFPVSRVLGQSESIVNKVFGQPVNRHPIHEPDKLAGGTEAEYHDGACWTLLDTAFYHQKLSWIEFFFKPTLPASEEELFAVLGLPKKEFQTISDTAESAWQNAHTKYRGVVDKRVIEIDASHPGPRDPVGFCQQIDIDLIETLD